MFNFQDSICGPRGCTAGQDMGSVCLRLAVGRQRGRNTTLIAAISDQCGILYHEIHYGSVTREIFSDFIASLSAIIADARPILVLDNAPIHNGIATVYPKLNFKFLPPYSPCLNPIENCFSVFSLRQAGRSES